MASYSASMVPSISLEQIDDVSHFHEPPRFASASVFYNKPVNICLSLDDKSEFEPFYETTWIVLTIGIGWSNSLPLRRIPSR